MPRNHLVKEIPIPDPFKDLRCLSCSDCDAVAPFTAHQFEHGETEVKLAEGWQLRLILTEVITDDGPGRALRWDFYCPEHAGDWNPRPRPQLARPDMRRRA